MKKLTALLLVAVVAVSLGALAAPQKVEARANPPAPPNLRITYYNQAVVFDWTVGSGGTDLIITARTGAVGNMGVTFREISFPYTGEKLLRSQLLFRALL